MKHFLKFLLLIIVLAPMAGCRSKKEAVTEIEQVENSWQNVSLPVKVQIVQPQKLSLSGSATMVRGEYILVSMRFLGFEIGRACITPQNADVVLRQPSKLWIQTPVANSLSRAGVSFSTIQETLLGDRSLLAKLPPQFNVSIGGTEQTPEVTVKATIQGKPAELKLTWNLNEAKWNQNSPASFSTPGSDYVKTDLAGLTKMLGGLK